MSSTYILTILLSVLTLTFPVSCVTIERSSSGDIFDASCNSCHLYNANCADGEFHIFSCCYKCACQYGDTIYKDLCRANFPQTELGCQVFIEGDEYYGLKTHKLDDEETDIGYIKNRWYWNRKVFYKCVIDDLSEYWDTKRWAKLFSGGRRIDDFVIENSDDGVFLKLSCDDDRWKLYISLLVKLSLTCYSYHSIPNYGSVQRYPNSLFWWPVGESSERYQGEYHITSCMAIKFAGIGSYDELPTTEIPITAKGKTTVQRITTDYHFPTSEIPITSKGKTTVQSSTTDDELPTSEIPITSKGKTTVQRTTTDDELPTTEIPITSKGKTTLQRITTDDEPPTSEIPITSKEKTTVQKTTTGYVSTISSKVLPDKPTTSNPTQTANKKTVYVSTISSQVLPDKPTTSNPTQTSNKKTDYEKTTTGKPFTSKDDTTMQRTTDKGYQTTFKPTNSTVKRSTTGEDIIPSPKNGARRDDGKYYKGMFEVVTPAICIMIFIVVFCVAFILCYKRRPVILDKQSKKNLWLESYGSCDSTDSLLNSNEYAIIAPPSYADVYELESLGKFPGERNAPPAYSMEKPSRAEVDAYHGERPASEDWDGTLYMRTDQLHNSK